MRPRHCVLALALALFTAAPRAQTIEIASPPAARAPGSLPERGRSMNEVEARFGAPAQRSAAVGSPPITRWSYPNFTVYFEYGHVVHAVAQQADADALAAPPPTTPQ